MDGTRRSSGATLATACTLLRHRGHSKDLGLSRGRRRMIPNGGVADNLDEAKAAFRAAWERQTGLCIPRSRYSGEAFRADRLQLRTPVRSPNFVQRLPPRASSMTFSIDTHTVKNSGAG